MSKKTNLIDPQAPRESIEVESMIAQSLKPILPLSVQQNALRQRLLDRARQSHALDAHYLTVRRNEGQWDDLTTQIQVKTLCPQSGAVLMRLQAGAVLPRHQHSVDEECIVLQGSMLLGDTRAGAGDYHCAPAGSRHTRIQAESDALIYLRGTALDSRLKIGRDLAMAWLPGKRPAPKTIHAGDGCWQQLLPGVQVKSLHEADGIRSMLIKLEPGARLPQHHHEAAEECLLLDGELFLGDTLMRTGDYQFAPAGTQHRETFSDTGALFYVRGAA